MWDVEYKMKKRRGGSVIPPYAEFYLHRTVELSGLVVFKIQIAQNAYIIITNKSSPELIGHWPETTVHDIRWKKSEIFLWPLFLGGDFCLHDSGSQSFEILTDSLSFSRADDSAFPFFVS